MPRYEPQPMDYRIGVPNVPDVPGLWAWRKEFDGSWTFILALASDTQRAAFTMDKRRVGEDGSWTYYRSYRRGF